LVPVLLIPLLSFNPRARDEREYMSKKTLKELRSFNPRARDERESQ